MWIWRVHHGWNQDLISGGIPTFLHSIWVSCQHFPLHRHPRSSRPFLLNLQCPHPEPLLLQPHKLYHRQTHGFHLCQLCLHPSGFLNSNTNEITSLFQNETEVAITFCSLYSLLRWVSLPICPLTLFFLSWHFFLSSRRADKRALRVPKHAMSIFLMMIPLATAWFDDLETVQELKNKRSDFGGKKTAEQKRKELKSLAMR